MKKSIVPVILFCFTILLASCQKDETTPSSGGSSTPSNTINYTPKAPDCLITDAILGEQNAVAFIEYDNLKRPIRVFVDGPEKFEETYQYTAKTLINQQWDLSVTPKKLTSTRIRYLNSNGLTDSLVSGSDNITYFYYRQDGFLQRKIYKHTQSSFLSGESFAYNNGNLTQTYTLRFNANETEPYDSVPDETYLYNNNYPNTFAAMDAWFEREGKPSANDYNKQSSSNGNYYENIKMVRSGNKLTHTRTDNEGTKIEAVYTLLCK